MIQGKKNFCQALVPSPAPLHLDSFLSFQETQMKTDPWHGTTAPWFTASQSMTRSLATSGGWWLPLLSISQVHIKDGSCSIYLSSHKFWHDFLLLFIQNTRYNKENPSLIKCKIWTRETYFRVSTSLVFSPWTMRHFWRQWNYCLTIQRSFL